MRRRDERGGEGRERRSWSGFFFNETANNEVEKEEIGGRVRCVKGKGKKKNKNSGVEIRDPLLAN